MKKLVLLLCSAAGVAGTNLEVIAQASIAGLGGNTGTLNTQFLGWDDQTTFPLNIRHFRFDQPIVFSTNPGTVNNQQPTVSTNRMWIAAGDETRVGIGTANPLHTLTVYRPVAGAGASSTLQITSPYSGTGQSNGLVLTSSVNFNTAQYITDVPQATISHGPAGSLINPKTGPLVFNVGTGGLPNLIMMPFSATSIYAANTFASQLANHSNFNGMGLRTPHSRLHISDGSQNGFANFTSNSYRSWMRTGTMNSIQNNHFYIGHAADHGQTASSGPVVAWGEQTPTTGSTANDLRFIFTSGFASGASGTPTSQEGLEAMRITQTGQVGIGIGTPGNRLHVAGGGVRFSNLPASSSTNVVVIEPNGDLGINASLSGGGGLLTANNGLTATGSNVRLGGALIQNTDLSLSNHVLSLSGFDPDDKLMIGPDFNNPLSVTIPVYPWLLQPNEAKVQVYQPSSTTTGNANDLGLHVRVESLEGIGAIMEGGVIGVHGSANQGLDGSDYGQTGVYGEAIGESFGTLIGIRGYATPGTHLTINSSPENYGGFFEASSEPYMHTETNTGVYGTAINSSANRGGRFHGFVGGSISGENFGIDATSFSNSSSSSVINYGVFASAGSTNAAHVNYGIYAIAANPTTALGPNYAGYFAGDLAYTGQFGFASDNALKRNVNTLDSALYIINQLRPVDFRFKRNQYPQMNLARGKQYGLIAQEVQQVLPAIVQNNVHPAKRDSLGTIIHPEVNYKSVNYTELIPYLIRGMQEQQAQIDSLRNTLATLTSVGNARTMAGRTEVELSNQQPIVLDQNAPNPFAERTSIRFVLPETYTSALMLFHDNTGRLVKSVKLTDKGEGHLDVFAAKLSTGIYTYTLVVDGAVIDSKRMVHQK